MRVACPHCSGSGVIADFLPEVCFYCEGDGVVDEEPDDRPDTVGSAFEKGQNGTGSPGEEGVDLT